MIICLFYSVLSTCMMCVICHRQLLPLVFLGLIKIFSLFNSWNGISVHWWLSRDCIIGVFDFFSAGLGTEIFCAVSWKVSGNECMTFILICSSWTEAFIFMSHQGVIFQCRNYVKGSWYCILCERIYIFLNIPLSIIMKA